MDALKYAAQLRAPPPHGAPYSVPLPATEQQDRTAIYRHWRFPGTLLETLDPKIRTSHDLFEAAANKQPTRPCLGYRPYNLATKTFGNYQWMDYGTVQKRRAAFGVGIREIHKRIGITDEKYGVGLWSQNRPEWQITDLACMSQSLFSISLYDTLGPSAIEYIINHASLVCVATSLPHIPTLLRLKSRLPSLKLIISLDALDHGEQVGYSKADLVAEMAAEVGVQVFSLPQVEAIGESLGPIKMNPPMPSDLVTINYTSGTTGQPKGALLSHRAAVAASTCSLSLIKADCNDITISYLPLAHIYGRLVEQGALWVGARIGYFHGNILELVDDMKLLKPTGFNSVPRLYNRFGGAIRAATTSQPGLKGALSRHVVATKLAQLADPESPHATNKHMVYDRIWGNKVAAALGLEKVQTMVNGSAPIDPSLHQFLRAVLGNRFLQGWGMTETYAVGLGQIIGDLSTGNCGAVMPSHEMCLLSIPDMEYLVTDKPDPRGELLIKGHTLFDGYYKNDEETAKSFTPDGWFKTGDICSIDARGRFKIIDRRKTSLKLAQGEYISPERIENVYLSHLTYLSQAFVHGDSVQTFLVAIFGVSPDLFAPWASKILGQPIQQTDLQAIAAACKEPKIRQAVLRELDAVGKRDRFQTYERVKNCYLYLEPFTIQNELLTPTLKLKRPQAAKKFRTELDELYAETLAELKDALKARL